MFSLCKARDEGGWEQILWWPGYLFSDCTFLPVLHVRELPEFLCLSWRVIVASGSLSTMAWLASWS